ncbi:MAG: hypothetical protein PHP44_03940 [Kiritimatiellae bacterium]|nr:hypothetical protein [Kiritimatiellia bacterium]MDD4735239.1 hypothetical protein [Kiritimatiellia bacterium]
MKSTYQKHTATDKRFLARHARREKAMILMPLLSTLCFVIGFFLLALSLIVFEHTALFRWLRFSLLYIVAGSLFLLVTLWCRGRDRTLQRNRDH